MLEKPGNQWANGTGVTNMTSSIGQQIVIWRNTCHKDHNLETELDVFIIEHGIHDMEKRKRVEDKYICKLQTFKGSGMNSDLGPYAREMYESWKSCLNIWRHSITSQCKWRQFNNDLSSFPLNLCYVV